MSSREVRPSNMLCQSLSTDGNPNRLYSPTLSSITQYSLPSATRSPRPTICIYLANDSVGLANCMNSTSGQSKPSENKSTLTSTSISSEVFEAEFREEESEEDLNLSISSCRSASGVLLEIATALMPFSR